jgi:hypothetical protein
VLDDDADDECDFDWLEEGVARLGDCVEKSVSVFKDRDNESPLMVTALEMLKVPIPDAVTSREILGEASSVAETDQIWDEDKVSATVIVPLGVGALAEGVRAPDMVKLAEVERETEIDRFSVKEIDPTDSVVLRVLEKVGCLLRVDDKV